MHVYEWNVVGGCMRGSAFTDELACFLQACVLIHLCMIVLMAQTK